MASGKFSSPRASRNPEEFPVQDIPVDSSCAGTAVKKALPGKAVLALCAAAAAVVLGLGGWFGIRALADNFGGRISEGVTLGGVDVGGDWAFSKKCGAYADVTCGFHGIHRSGFKTIEQTLIPIYGSIGVTYAFD